MVDKNWDEFDWVEGDELVAEEWSKHAREHRDIYDDTSNSVIADVDNEEINTDRLVEGIAGSGVTISDLVGAGLIEDQEDLRIATQIWNENTNEIVADVNNDSVTSGSVSTGAARINTHGLFIQDTAPSDPDVGDVWIDNTEAFK